MYWAIFLFWFVAAISISVAICYFGFRTSWRFYLDRTAVHDRDTSPNEQASPQAAAPTPTTASSPTDGEAKIPSVAEILEDGQRKKYESANIGGATVLFQTLPHLSKNNLEGVAVIFRQVQDKDALVNVALAGKVLIRSVMLITEDSNPKHRKLGVQIVVQNQTAKAVKIVIPRGQVFEHKQLMKKQNLAAESEHVITIPAPKGRNSPYVAIKIPALCINKGLDLPRDSLGNITIFELSNSKFLDQEDLWDWINQRINEEENSQLLMRRTS